MHNDALIAVVDIGKTHSKLLLLSAGDSTQVWSVRRSNAVCQNETGLQLDIHGIEAWLLEQLSLAPGKQHITTIVPVGHGAAAVLVDAKNQVISAADYEDTQFNSVSSQYDLLRDVFENTFSPNLPLGLNLGRQLYFLQSTHANLFKNTTSILLYPQYWAWRFSGVKASEVTSLGCHTDLWYPKEAQFSKLAVTQGWDHLFPPIRPAQHALNPITKAVAARTGLPEHCRVICGIHDSNASFLQHLLNYNADQPFTVVSSGTWTVILSSGVELNRLQAERDMLANVDALGRPVATARFMGGREYAAIANTDASPTIECLKTVLEKNAYALPAFAPAGPFSKRSGVLENCETLNDGERAALATLYCSLMTDLILDNLGSQGDVVVDGPLAGNALFTALLATWRNGQRVLSDPSVKEISDAIRFLSGLPKKNHRPAMRAQPLCLDELQAYRQQWRGRALD
jgi:L-fuculokinase